MVVFVFAPYILKDFDRFLHGGGFHHHFLETPFQGAVFFDVLPVLIQGRGPDALYFPPCQGRLEHVGGIQAARGASGPDDRMDLVDKQDHVVVLLQFVHHGFHPFLKLAAVLGPGHQRSQVQGDYPLVVKDPRHLLVDDAQGQALGDGALAHARFPDKQGVVLLPAAQDLRNPLNFLFPAYNRVELVLLGQAGKVPPEIVQYGGL